MKDYAMQLREVFKQFTYSGILYFLDPELEKQIFQFIDSDNFNEYVEYINENTNPAEFIKDASLLSNNFIMSSVDAKAVENFTSVDDKVEEVLKQFYYDLINDYISGSFTEDGLYAYLCSNTINLWQLLNKGIVKACKGYSDYTIQQAVLNEFTFNNTFIFDLYKQLINNYISKYNIMRTHNSHVARANLDGLNIIELLVEIMDKDNDVYQRWCNWPNDGLPAFLLFNYIVCENNKDTFNKLFDNYLKDKNSILLIVEDLISAKIYHNFTMDDMLIVTKDFLEILNMPDEFSKTFITGLVKDSEVMKEFKIPDFQCELLNNHLAIMVFDTLNNTKLNRLEQVSEKFIVMHIFNKKEDYLYCMYIDNDNELEFFQLRSEEAINTKAYQGIKMELESVVKQLIGRI